jgi:hypothetical protein
LIFSERLDFSFFVLSLKRWLCQINTKFRICDTSVSHEIVVRVAESDHFCCTRIITANRVNLLRTVCGQAGIIAGSFGAQWQIANQNCADFTVMNILFEYYRRTPGDSRLPFTITDNAVWFCDA